MDLMTPSIRTVPREFVSVYGLIGVATRTVDALALAVAVNVDSVFYLGHSSLPTCCISVYSPRQTYLLAFHTDCPCRRLIPTISAA